MWQRKVWPISNLDTGPVVVGVTTFCVFVTCLLMNVDLAAKEALRLLLVLLLSVLVLVVAALLIVATIVEKFKVLLVLPFLVLVPSLFVSAAVLLCFNADLLLVHINFYTLVYLALLTGYFFVVVLAFAVDNCKEKRLEDVEKAEDEPDCSLLDHKDNDDTFTALAQRNVEKPKGSSDYAYCLPVDSLVKASSSMSAMSSRFPKPCEVISIENESEQKAADTKSSFDDDFVGSKDTEGKEDQTSIRERRSKSHNALLDIDCGKFSPYKSKDMKEAESSNVLPTKMHIFLPNDTADDESSTDSADEDAAMAT